MGLLPIGLIVDIRYYNHGWIKSNASDAVWDGVRKPKTPKDSPPRTSGPVHLRCFGSDTASRLQIRWPPGFVPAGDQFAGQAADQLSYGVFIRFI